MLLDKSSDMHYLLFPVRILVVEEWYYQVNGNQITACSDNNSASVYMHVSISVQLSFSILDVDGTKKWPNRVLNFSLARPFQTAHFGLAITRADRNIRESSPKFVCVYMYAYTCIRIHVYACSECIILYSSSSMTKAKCCIYNTRIAPQRNRNRYK